MKIRGLLSTIFLVFWVAIFAQNSVLNYSKAQTFYLDEIPLAKADMYLCDKLEIYFNFPSNHQLVKKSSRTSPAAKHITYLHYIDGQKVLYSGVKVHIKRNNSVVIQSYLTSLPVIDFQTNYDCLLPLKHGLISVIKSADNSTDRPQFIYRNGDGVEVYREDQGRYFKKDTIVHGTVFQVNPINSANTVYGGAYTDQSDSNTTVLENELVWVSIPAKFEDDTFYLESDAMRFKSLSFPNELSDYQQVSDTFDFNRYDDEFEAFNAFYHINTFASYVKQLGHNGMIDVVSVDVHGQGGSDQSTYFPHNHSIHFGDGGVDDAEDGEVIVHEYTHSLSEMASPETNSGTNRESIDEGLCDYFCKSYSRTYNDNNPNKVFTWDGWNEFWDGAEINTNKYYPADLKNQLYGDRDLWSSLLMCFHDKLGRETADSLIFEHMYYLLPDMKMHDLADELIKIDSADFNGRYYLDLLGCMEPAGFRKYGVSVPTVKQSSFIQVKNSLAFMQGDGNLKIELNKYSSWSIIDVTGKVMLSNEGKLLELEPNDFIKGVYILNVRVGNDIISFKILR
ncbi:MAG: hypothetical protein KJP21_06940 [Bacteroidia bacterium]|nr:hypothetical protein [Bacteroidia bacterium]NNJ56523.1 hypothetical protein [Bacteroidia bacterium]